MTIHLTSDELRKRYPQRDLIARQTAIRADELTKLIKVSIALDALLTVHDEARSPFSSAFDRAELALYDALASINGIEDAAHEQAEMLRDMLTPRREA